MRRGNGDWLLFIGPLALIGSIIVIWSTVASPGDCWRMCSPRGVEKYEMGVCHCVKAVTDGGVP